MLFFLEWLFLCLFAYHFFIPQIFFQFTLFLTYKMLVLYVSLSLLLITCQSIQDLIPQIISSLFSLFPYFFCYISFFFLSFDVISLFVSFVSFTQLCHLFASIAISLASALATCNCRSCSFHCRCLCGYICIYIFNAFHHYWCCNFINRSDVALLLPIRSDGRPRFLPINFSCDWSGWIIIQLKLDLSPCFPHSCLRLLSCLTVCLSYF